MKGIDDGLLGRFMWAWPMPVDFRIGTVASNAEWAIAALDRLRMLQMTAGPASEPVKVPLAAEGRELLDEFGRETQRARKRASSWMRSAYGKARGQVLRLSLVLQFLW
jgi:hypothetical protein